MTQASDIVSDNGSSSLNKERTRPAHHADPIGSTIRRKTARARQSYFDGATLENEGAASQCDTVRRRRQKSVAYWQQGSDGGDGLVAEETDSGIALTTECELLTSACSGNGDRPAIDAARRKLHAATGSIQTASLKVPDASQWGSAFDTMVAELRCRLPGASGPDKLTASARERPEQPRDGEPAAEARDSSPAAAVWTKAASQGFEQQSGGESQDGSSCVGSSESGNCCREEWSAVNRANNDGSDAGTDCGNGSVATGNQVPCTFRDIIYRRTGKSLTIDIVPPIVKTASNNEVWIKLRNDQDDGLFGKNALKTRHSLPQPASSHRMGEKKKRSGGAGEQPSGRFQKLRRLFSLGVSKKEQSARGRTRVTVKGDGGGGCGQRDQ